MHVKQAKPKQKTALTPDDGNKVHAQRGPDVHRCVKHSKEQFQQMTFFFLELVTTKGRQAWLDITARNGHYKKTDKRTDPVCPKKRQPLLTFVNNSFNISDPLFSTFYFHIEIESKDIVLKKV